MAEDTGDSGSSWTRARTVISTIARLVMGGIFIYAGYTKIIDVEMAKLSVESYQIFPRDLAHLIGIALPVLEIALGLLLLVGLGTRISAAIIAIMLVAFIAGITSLWIRGINTQCGCFGGSLIPQGDPDYLVEILRDAAMLVATLWVVVWPRTYFALETLLSRRSGDADTDDVRPDEASTEPPAGTEPATTRQ